MLYDLQVDSLDSNWADICISGAGPAGITLARKLAANGKKVILLEAGRLKFDSRSQALYECENTGRHLWPASTRLRYFGGTSNHWAGRCRPFERFDFERASYGELPGWPIDYDEFNSYLPEAMAILDLPKEGFRAINDGLDDYGFKADVFAKSPPTRFGKKYLKELSKSDNIKVYLNANSTFLHFDDDGSVKELDVKNYNGVEFHVDASDYVFAMGAIENARVLLNSRLTNGRAPGDQSGFLGKCFMEHMNIKIGEFLLENDGDDLRSQYFTTAKLASDRRIGRSNLSFGKLEEIKSYGRAAKIKNFFKILACDWGIEKKVEFISKFDCPGTGTIGTLMEQTASPSNRVYLIRDVDALGLRKANIHWDLSEQDVRTIEITAEAIAKAFAAAGLGYIRINDAIVENKLENLLVAPHAHHMGTTRMAAIPEFGVVDRNCRVYGTKNLYIAGSSVFPTGGGGNPTMPLIQLALRLAKYLS